MTRLQLAGPLVERRRDTRRRYLHVHEVDDDGRIIYEGRFDEDDFEGAYRELERRYYAGEGAAFAEAGATSDRVADRVEPRRLRPGVRRAHRPRTARREPVELGVSAIARPPSFAPASRNWTRWSPRRGRGTRPCIGCRRHCGVARLEREAVGQDGEQYAWTRSTCTRSATGRIASVCQFELDDEEAAFAYAEERVRAATSRLALTNWRSRTWDEGLRALQTRDVDGAVACYAEPFVYDDRRRLAGMPIGDVRTAHERILAQYTHFEGRTLAVRGERLHLGWIRWSNESGFETCYLIVHEVDENRRIDYEGRFDEDDFEGAYRELERRYFAGEGAEFAEAGLVADRVTDRHGPGRIRPDSRLISPIPRFCLENRSRSIFPDRSASEMTRRFRRNAQHGRVDPDVEFGAVLAVAVRFASATSSGRRPAMTAERYAWTRNQCRESSATGKSHRCACSSPTTRPRRSRTPRNGCACAEQR